MWLAAEGGAARGAQPRGLQRRGYRGIGSLRPNTRNRYPGAPTDPGSRTPDRRARRSGCHEIAEGSEVYRRGLIDDLGAAPAKQRAVVQNARASRLVAFFALRLRDEQKCFGLQDSASRCYARDQMWLLKASVARSRQGSAGYEPCRIAKAGFAGSCPRPMPMASRPRPVRGESGSLTAPRRRRGSPLLRHGGIAPARPMPSARARPCPRYERPFQN